MKKIIILFYVLLSACGEIHQNSYELYSDVPDQFVKVFERADSIDIKINDKKAMRNISLKKVNGLYFENKIINTFEKDTSSYILLFSNRNDTSFVVTYAPSIYPSIPAESEDCSIVIRRFNSDIFYTKKTSLLNKQHFDIYFYNAKYRIIAILYSRVNKQYLFVDKKSEYISDIMPYINKYKESGSEL